MAQATGQGSGKYLETPGARAAAMAQATGQGTGKFVEKLGERASYLRNKVQGLRYGAMGGNTGAGYKIPLKTPNILDDHQRGGMKKPKLPPKVALALRSLPAGALKFLGLKEVTEETGLKGEDVPKDKGTLKERILRGSLRLIGPLLLLYELDRLITNWQETSETGDINPFGGDPADRVFKVGLARLAASYGVGYFGAMAGAVAGMQIGGPYVSAALGLSGGFVGAVFGDVLMSRALETDKEEIDRKKAKLADLGRHIEVMHQSGQERQAQGLERQYKNLSEEISVLEAGPVDDIDAVVVIQNSDNSSTSVSSQNIGTTIQASESYNPVPIFGATFGYR